MNTEKKETNTYIVTVCDKEILVKKTRSNAIKAHCTDCSGGNRTEVKECFVKNCPLYPFRGYINWNSDKRGVEEVVEIEEEEEENDEDNL
jgi:hypothetical protein